MNALRRQPIFARVELPRVEFMHYHVLWCTSMHQHHLGKNNLGIQVKEDPLFAPFKWGVMAKKQWRLLHRTTWTCRSVK